MAGPCKSVEAQIRVIPPRDAGAEHNVTRVTVKPVRGNFRSPGNSRQADVSFVTQLPVFATSKKKRPANAGRLVLLVAGLPTGNRQT